MDEQILTVDQWNDWWKRDYQKSKDKSGSGSAPSHDHEDDNPFTQASQMLKKHIGTLCPSKENMRVFVPLCGKSPDMKWLLEDVGCEIIGLECSEHAITGFFEENEIEYEVTVAPGFPNFHLFKGKNSKIRVFQGDYFQFSAEAAGGTFDAIWDSASLNTIDLSLRKPYVEVIKSLMTKDTKYMLSAMYFGDLRTWKDNPFDITDDSMQEMFGEHFGWRKLDEDKSEWGLERIFLISLK